MPKVSVIVPNYNHAPYLAQRLESVLNQTYRDFEVIILDDKSTDNSLEIIEQYQNHPIVSKVLVNEVNSGSPFKQWDKGIQLARGEYIWIAESDDYTDERFLEVLVDKLDKNTQVGVAYCQSWRVDKAGTILFSGQNWYDERWSNDHIHRGLDEIQNLFVHVCVIPNASAALFKKDVYSHIEKNYTRFKSVGDWQFWVELLLQCDLAFCAEHLNYFRLSDTSVSYASDKQWIGVLERYKILSFIKKKQLHLKAKRFYRQRHVLAGLWVRLMLSSRAENYFCNNWAVFKEAFLVDKLIIFRLLYLIMRVYGRQPKSQTA